MTPSELDPPSYEELKSAVLFLTGFSLPNPMLGPKLTAYYCRLTQRLGCTSPLMVASLAEAEEAIRQEVPSE